MKKYLLASLGLLSLTLGIIGMFLPILPTTPFLLLSAWLFSKSSQRLNHFLLNNRVFGNYIRNYRSGQGIPKRTKIFSIILLWTTIMYSNLVPLSHNHYLQTLLTFIAIWVTVHIAGNPTKKQSTFD